jgi:hypothetical protein
VLYTNFSAGILLLFEHQKNREVNKSLPAGACAQSQGSLYGICEGQSDTGADVSPRTSGFLAHYHATNVTFSHLSSVSDAGCSAAAYLPMEAVSPDCKSEEESTLFYGSRRFITVFTRARLWTLFSARWIYPHTSFLLR